MSDAVNQNDVDSLLNQLQQDTSTLAADTQALDEAAKLATDLAGEIHTSQGAPATPQEPAPAPAPTAETAAETPPAPDSSAPSPEIQRLLAIEVPVIVQLGMRRMTVGEVTRFAAGAIIEFSKSADEELELLVNNKSIAKGHAVKVGENFGIKLSQISPVRETIRKLGAA
jgi:flagellar motor switch protein FliN/FliY